MMQRVVIIGLLLFALMCAKQFAMRAPTQYIYQKGRWNKNIQSILLDSNSILNLRTPKYGGINWQYGVYYDLEIVEMTTLHNPARNNHKYI